MLGNVFNLLETVLQLQTNCCQRLPKATEKRKGFTKINEKFMEGIPNFILSKLPNPAFTDLNRIYYAVYRERIDKVQITGFDYTYKEGKWILRYKTKNHSFGSIFFDYSDCTLFETLEEAKDFCVKSFEDRMLEVTP